MDPNKEIERLEKKLSQSMGEKWNGNEKLLDEEERRLRRMEEIWEEANNARIVRCEAKMAEVGRDEFMNLIHGWGGESGKELWSDSEPNEITEIEKEYYRLRNEQFHLDWLREHGKLYRIEDDPQAKF